MRGFTRAGRGLWAICVLAGCSTDRGPMGPTLSLLDEPLVGLHGDYHILANIIEESPDGQRRRIARPQGVVQAGREWRLSIQPSPQSRPEIGAEEAGNVETTVVLGVSAEPVANHPDAIELQVALTRRSTLGVNRREVSVADVRRHVLYEPFFVLLPAVEPIKAKTLLMLSVAPVVRPPAHDDRVGTVPTDTPVVQLPAR